MTEMTGLGGAHCKKCHYCIELFRMMCYCYNVNSEHYGHLIMDFHPICNGFLQKGSV